MNWFKITLPNTLLERNEIAEMAREFYDVLKTFYNDKDHTGALLLCDDPLLKNGSDMPLLKQCTSLFLNNIWKALNRLNGKLNL